jgi:outer membrane protein TolC
MRPYSHIAQRLLFCCVLDFACIVSGMAQTPVRLTLHDAIEKALEANLSGQLASARIDEAEGTRLRRYAATMLPRITAQSYVNVQNRNLSAFGISSPAIPKMVGPFSNYSVNVYAQQNVIDLSSYHALKASEQTLETSKLDYKDARDLIVRITTSLYLNAESAEARVGIAQSRVTDSVALCKLAKDKHDAGTATGVDVLRAEVQLANDQQALLVAQNRYKQTLLSLTRNMGMAPSTQIELEETLHYQQLKESTSDALTESALAGRADYLSLFSQRKALQEQQHANRARYYPRLSLSGNYGGVGRSVGSIQGVGLVQGQIDITLFDRDRNGEAQELASRLRSIDDRIADLRHGIQQDIQAALLDLDSAASQVDVASQGQQLARRELELARDRFSEGTANNVEVVTAQDELARAEENYILAVSSHADAKFALARALGDTEKKIIEFSAINEETTQQPR